MNTSLSDRMGYHEFYCATYSSKDQPHIEGLLVTLTDNLRCKEMDMMVAKEKGEDFSSHKIGRKLLHNLLVSINRRIQLPEYVFKLRIQTNLTLT